MTNVKRLYGILRLFIMGKSLLWDRKTESLHPFLSAPKLGMPCDVIRLKKSYSWTDCLALYVGTVYLCKVEKRHWSMFVKRLSFLCRFCPVILLVSC